MKVIKECSDSWFGRKNRISSLPERDDPRCRWRVGSRTRSLENEDCSLGEEGRKEGQRWAPRDSFIFFGHCFQGNTCLVYVDIVLVLTVSN